MCPRRMCSAFRRRTMRLHRPVREEGLYCELARGVAALLLFQLRPYLIRGRHRDVVAATIPSERVPLLVRDDALRLVGRVNERRSARERRGDRENRVQAPEHDAEKEHFTDAGIDRHIHEMLAQRREVLLLVECL